MTDNEKDIQDMINKFNQQSSFMSNRSMIGNPNQGIDTHTGIDNQGPINESVPISPDTIQPSTGLAPIPTGNICSQCNMMHPPIKGEKCPNAIVKAMTEESDEIVVDVNKYLVNLQNILMSQIESKKIKDVNKLFKNITIEITKFLEEYKE
jgi:hypothetical protein